VLNNGRPAVARGAFAKSELLANQVFSTRWRRARSSCGRFGFHTHKFIWMKRWQLEVGLSLNSMARMCNHIAAMPNQAYESMSGSVLISDEVYRTIDYSR
jgi:hypothetical protein